MSRILERVNLSMRIQPPHGLLALLTEGRIVGAVDNQDVTIPSHKITGREMQVVISSQAAQGADDRRLVQAYAEQLV